jgi:hypothetical protein
MNKFFVSALASAGLMAVAASSQATAISYFLVTPAYDTVMSTDALNYAATPNTGLLTTNGQFANTLEPLGTTPLVFAAAPASNFAFGNDFTITEGGTSTTNSSGMWAAQPISFSFYIDTQNDATTTAVAAQGIEFTVTGVLTGTVGYSGGLGFSDASVEYMTITDDTIGSTAIITPNAMNPSSSSAAVEVQTTIDGVAVALWINKSYAKAVPGTSGIAQQAFISTTTTPEPGAVAMFVGMGVSGGIFLRRKRRA